MGGPSAEIHALSEKNQGTATPISDEDAPLPTSCPIHDPGFLCEILCRHQYAVQCVVSLSHSSDVER